MPRKYAKKPMKKRRPQRKRGIARQNFKNRVLAIVNKNREMKRLFFISWSNWLYSHYYF